ncbi:MAG TPA: ABC transporter substrate-binding protein [Steroidobacteraceae bacterium]|nr:ABC transporter substrate-binding protein [Steroidobacteraceae bacterium]
MRRPQIRILMAVAAVAVLAGCSKSGGEAAAGATIKVGEFASLTGKEATFGVSSHEGTLLAVEELNAAGGVLGKKLELVYEDNRSTPGESLTIAKKLINNDKVIAILGEVASGRSLEVAPFAQSSRVPQISPSSTNPDVTKIGDYIFRVCFIDPFQGKLLAGFAKNTLKAQKVALFSDVAAPYSVGLGKFFKEAWLAGGGELVSEVKYTGGDKDFKAQLTVIKNAKPDAIMVPGYYTDVGLIVAQARQLGITVPMFGGDGWEAPELIQIAGAENLVNTYYSTHFSPSSTDPLAQKFVAAYKAKYSGKVPDAMAALGYDSVMVLADAIKRAGTTDEPKLRDAIAATKDFPGATGITTLDANRDASKSAVIITVKDGKFQYLETVAP